jgi:hypothetical protein
MNLQQIIDSIASLNDQELLELAEGLFKYDPVLASDLEFLIHVCQMDETFSKEDL